MTKAIVIHAALHQKDSDRVALQDRLEEAEGLAHGLGLEVVESFLVSLRKVLPATLFGRGKLEDFQQYIEEHAIDLVVVDQALSPTQQRNLEKAWQAKVLDRTALILEIFGARARTKEGRLQVELAALNYQKSRLVRSWTHLERQRGGLGFIGGPGESQIELDRRMIGQRIKKIEKQLDTVKRTRALQRRARQRVPYPVVALVGYTNAGKSTLFNALTKSDVFVEDLLFATLDPTMRALKLPGGTKIILSDTVGFISELPHDLVAAFQATLEEVVSADLLLHVQDISHPNYEDQAAEVLQVLEELGVDLSKEHHMIDVYNKVDLLETDAFTALKNRVDRRANTCLVSAVDGQGLPALLDEIQTNLIAQHQEIRLTLPNESGETLAWLHQNATILERDDQEEGVHILCRISSAKLAHLNQKIT